MERPDGGSWLYVTAFFSELFFVSLSVDIFSSVMAVELIITSFSGSKTDAVFFSSGLLIAFGFVRCFLFCFLVREKALAFFELIILVLKIVLLFFNVAFSFSEMFKIVFWEIRNN